MACHWFGNMPLSEHYYIIYLGSWLRKIHSSQIQMFDLNMSLTYARDLSCLVCSVTTLSVWWIHIILALVTHTHVSVKWIISDSDVITPMSTYIYIINMWQSSRPASFSPAGLTLWPSWLERWLATLSGLSVQVRNQWGCRDIINITSHRKIL